MPLALTQAQLDQVMLIARPIRHDLREQFLELVAQLLAGQEIDEIVRETLRLPQALAGKIGQMMQ